MKKLLICSFFVIQFLGIALAIGKEDKFFAWVPFDQISTYEISVEVGQNSLSLAEVSDRYNLRNPGRENRSNSHIFSRITQYEATYGKLDSAQVKVLYSVNGKAEQSWVLKD